MPSAPPWANFGTKIAFSIGSVFSNIGLSVLDGGGSGESTDAARKEEDDRLNRITPAAVIPTALSIPPAIAAVLDIGGEECADPTNTVAVAIAEAVAVGLSKDIVDVDSSNVVEAVDNMVVELSKDIVDVAHLIVVATVDDVVVGKGSGGKVHLGKSTIPPSNPASINPFAFGSASFTV